MRSLQLRIIVQAIFYQCRELLGCSPPAMRSLQLRIILHKLFVRDGNCSAFGFASPRPNVLKKEKPAREAGCSFFSFQTFAQASLARPEKLKKPAFNAGFSSYPYSGRDLNPYDRNGHWILSPTCLPIPPPERAACANRLYKNKKTPVASVNLFL